MAYLSQDPPIFRLEKEHRSGGLEYAFAAYGDPAPPLRFSVIAGEIIHHMRSSLDHLVHALVVQHGKTPTRQNQFPICTTEKAFKQACQRGQLEGVGPTAKKLIHSVQPFTTPTPDDTLLFVVSEYDNADKHRLLVVVTAVADIGDTITIGTDEAIAESSERQGKVANIVGLGEPGPKKLSKEGVVVFSIRLAEPAPEFTADASLELQLALAQCGRVKFAPLINTMRHLLAGTQNTIEMFAGEF